MMRGVQGWIHLMPLRGAGVHHLGTSLKLGQVLLQLQLRIGGRHVLLLLRRGCSAVLISIEAGTSSHLGVRVGVGRAGSHPDGVANATMD